MSRNIYTLAVVTKRFLRELEEGLARAAGAEQFEVCEGLLRNALVYPHVDVAFYASFMDGWSRSHETILDHAIRRKREVPGEVSRLFHDLSQIGYASCEAPVASAIAEFVKSHKSLLNRRALNDYAQIMLLAALEPWAGFVVETKCVGIMLLTTVGPSYDDDEFPQE